MTPEEALDVLRPGDAALGRLDVLASLDGVDDGLWALGALEARGVTVLNDASALLATHDKLLTARLLHRVGVPHPRTVHVRADRPFPAVRPPVVVKPRFGSGGNGVTWCGDETDLVETLVIVVRDALVRAARRARAGSRGAAGVRPPHSRRLGQDRRSDLPGGRGRRMADQHRARRRFAVRWLTFRRQACELALIAAHVVGRRPRRGRSRAGCRGGWTVIELNGAVEFTGEYQLAGDVFADVAGALVAQACARTTSSEAASTAA